MKKVTVLVGFVILGMALIASTGSSGDKKDSKPGKAKGQLPPGWTKLGLTVEQKSSIYTIMGTYKKKIMALEEQIKDLRAQEKTEMVGVLTADQKDQLRRLAVGDDTPKDKSDKAPPGKDDKKDKAPKDS
jgi:hypothetical protein